jgi:hypothetical protein
VTEIMEDPYGLEFGDWEDPYDHDYCTGCDMCRPWEGCSHEAIRAVRAAEVSRRRGELAAESARVAHRPAN